jgi:iron complex outermembrane receptor protein
LPDKIIALVDRRTVMKRAVYLLMITGIFFLLNPKAAFCIEGLQDIQDISLDSLLNIQISTAAKYEQKSHEAPASVTIITSEDMERYGYRTLDEVFAGIRGFYLSNDRNYSYLGTRGFSRPSDYNNRMLIMVNGHTTNEYVYGSALIGNELALNMEGVERIEIVRGPGSVLYGTGAMFGVINILTKKGYDIDGLRLSGETGSYGKLLGSVIYGNQFSNGMEIFTSGLWTDIDGQDLYFEEFDDPSTNNGIAEHLDRDKNYSLLTTMSYKDFTFLGNLTSREKGIPTGAWGVAFNNSAYKTVDGRNYFEVKYDRGIGADKNIMARGYFDHYNYEGTFPYEEEDEVINWNEASDGKWVGGELQFRWDPWLKNRLIVGTEYNRHFRADYRSWDIYDNYFSGDFPFNVFSIYFQDEYQVVKDLSLTVGIRRDEYSTVGNSTTPRGALVYHPFDGTTFKVLYGEAFRAPNIYEVYYEDEDVSISNPNLKPEKIKTAEIVWEQRFTDILFGSMSFYDYEMKDLIDQFIDPVDSLSQFRNTSRVDARGLELELKTKLKNGLWSYGSYTFQTARDAGTGMILTNSPRHILKLGFSYPVINYLYAAAEMQYETDRITLTGTKTDPYFITNLTLSSKQLFDHMRVSFLVRNLFDTNYATPSGFEHIGPISEVDMATIKQNGRNFAVHFDYRY